MTTTPDDLGVPMMGPSPSIPTMNEVIAQHPDIDRQHVNQLIRIANQEQKQNKPPAAARKLFKYLRDLEENQG